MIISNTGRLAYADALALHDFGKWGISFEDAYLGTLGKGAVALHYEKELAALAAAALTLSAGEQAGARYLRDNQYSF